MGKTDILSTADVEREYGIPVETLRWRRTNRTGPRWFRLGARRVYYAREDVEAWIAEAREPGDAA